MKHPMIRFQAKVQFGAGCWEWIGGRDKDGYGKFWLNDSCMGAHRAAWLLYGNKIPDGLFVLHGCDNPGCVKPDHLFLGTSSDNMLDMFRKGRGKVHLDKLLHTPGEKHGKALITDAQALQILALKNSGLRGREVAERFRTTRVAVWKIWRGITWRHLSHPTRGIETGFPPTK